MLSKPSFEFTKPRNNNIGICGKLKEFYHIVTKVTFKVEFRFLYNSSTLLYPIMLLGSSFLPMQRLNECYPSLA